MDARFAVELTVEGMSPLGPHGDRFRIVRPLGEGGMGVVYEAFDATRKKTVALKTIRDAHGDAVYRLKREFRALAGLEHPNLVRLYDLFVDSGSCFFTMEYVPGRELGAWLSAPRRAIDELDATIPSSAPDGRRFDAIRSAIDSLARGLEALHGAGLLHRDLKPSNVMVDESDRVVLLDFGLVADAHAAIQQTIAGAVAGTIAYMAPEQARGESELTTAVDRYALGVILFELLTGTVPFRGSSLVVLAEKVTRDAPRPSELVANVPTDLDELTRALLARDPTERPSLSEIRAAVTRNDPTLRTTTTRSSGKSAAPFIGRAPELDRLLAALEKTARGRAGIALVRGRSGIGKSALLAAFAREAESRTSALVLAGRCHEFEMVPYKGLDGVIDTLSRYLTVAAPEELGRILPPDLGDLATIFPVLRRVAPIASAYARRSTAERPVQRIRATGLACLREMLRRIAECAALVVAIDDVQWADDDTSRALVELLRDSHPPAMLLLLGSRPDDDTPVIREFFGRRDRSSTVDVDRLRVELEPLDAAATSELIRRELGPTVPATLVETLARESEGSPFAACELARFVREDDGDVTVTIEGRSIDELVVERAGMLDPSSRRLLDVIAVSGEPTDERTLRRAAGLDEDDRASTDVLRSKLWIRSSRSETSTMLDAIHDRVRESIARALGAERRAAVHRSLALALESSENAPHDRLARHFAAAGDAGLGHHHALAAAEEAHAGLALRRASELLALAVDLATPEQRARLMPRYAESLADAGLFEHAAETWKEASSLSEGTDRREFKRRAAEAWLYAGRIDRGLDLLDDIAGKAGIRISMNRFVALAQVVWERLRLRIRGYSTRIRSENEIGARELDLLRTIRAMALAYTPLDQVRGSIVQARWLRLALDVGHAEDISVACSVEVAIAAVWGDVRARDRATDALGRLATLATPPPYELCRLMGTTMWQSLNGSHREARATARRLDELTATTTMAPTLRSMAHYAATFARIRSISPEEHSSMIRFLESREEGAGPFAETRLRVFRAIHDMASGDAELVVRQATEHSWDEVTRRELAWTCTARMYQAWAHCYLGDAEAAYATSLESYRIAQATWLTLSSMGLGTTLVRWSISAFVLGRTDEVVANVKRYGKGRSSMHEAYRLHLEALEALALRRREREKLVALADFGREAGMEQLEGAGLWALGTLLEGDEGVAFRNRFVVLVAGSGLVDPDRYFWSLLPIGAPPPRRRSTKSRWSVEPGQRDRTSTPPLIDTRPPAARTARRTDRPLR